MIQNPEVATDSDAVRLLANLDLIAREEGWLQRLGRLLFPWRARYDRAVHSALAALVNELTGEKRERLEAIRSQGVVLDEVRERTELLDRKSARLEALGRALESGARGLEVRVDELRQRLAFLQDEQKSHDYRLGQIAEQNRVDHASFERLVPILNHDVRELDGKVATLSDTFKDLINGVPVFENRVAAETFERFYLAFENRYRGGREDIKRRLSVYLPLIAQCDALRNVPREAVKMLDLGCGRGEWLEFLHGEGYTAAVGVDTNLKMVGLCRDLGLPVEHANGMEYLGRQPNHSICVLSAAHLVEHIPFAALLKLLNEARRTIASGGLLILETPNCNNVLTATQNFPSDPTHRLPLPPNLLSFAAEFSGFLEVQILPLHPYSADYHVKGETQLARRFNDYFYGPQDYALIAKNP